MDNIYTLFSQNLDKETNIAVHGHYGVSFLMFPSTTDDYFENEENGFLDGLSHQIKIGTCRTYNIDGFLLNGWLNRNLSNEEKSINHLCYNKFIEEEIVSFIYKDCGGPVPIITCGASMGGFLAANAYFRRPDIFLGTISLSSTFNIQHYSGEYFDENCYFNSPIHYLPNLTDNYWMSFLTSRHHVFLASGSGENEFPHNTNQLSNILRAKNIRHISEIWDTNWGHNIDTWKTMLQKFVKSFF